jgi:hypothetical protein
VSACLGRCGDNWVTEDGEIGLPPPGDIGRHDAHCSYIILSHKVNVQPRLKEVMQTQPTVAAEYSVPKCRVHQQSLGAFHR